MKCEYAREDGAYVLGALAPIERSGYERHLAGCAQCRDAVAVLAVLPGLLGRLDAAAAEQVALEATAVEPSRLPSLVLAAQAERRRERTRARRRISGSALVAACLALVMGLGIGLVRETPPTVATPVVMAAMIPAVTGAPRGPVSAEIGMSSVNGGTKIRMHCSYSSAGDYHDPWPFRLYAYGKDGRSEEVGSWVAGPGDDLWLDGMTRYRTADLTRLELRTGDGAPLLVFNP
ncbi:MAG TPA: zf-HC2 domain-containing protein [Micromonosporaceae bacterium]|jgi:hypothetical protein|nr:zf-HC2 domain-containing protein [Micromonosporaceae bacterium]